MPKTFSRIYILDVTGGGIRLVVLFPKRKKYILLPYKSNGLFHGHLKVIQVEHHVITRRKNYSTSRIKMLTLRLR